jgi:hypothetical protein
MNQITRKIKLALDVYPMRSKEDDPIVAPFHLRTGGWVPDPVENGVRAIVELDVPVNVLFDEIDLPPATAVPQ